MWAQLGVVSYDVVHGQKLVLVGFFFDDRTRGCRVQAIALVVSIAGRASGMLLSYSIGKVVVQGHEDGSRLSPSQGPIVQPYDEGLISVTER